MSGAGTPLQQQPPQMKHRNLFSRILHRLLAFWWALIVLVVLGLVTNILIIPLRQGLDQFWPHVRDQINALLMLQVTQPLLFDATAALVILLTVGGFFAHRQDTKQHHQTSSPAPTNTNVTFQEPVVDNRWIIKEGNKTEYHEPVVRIGTFIASDPGLAPFSNTQDRKTPPEGTSPKIRNIPYQQNHYFTGRDEVIERLHADLITDKIAAISGSDGIGKTQTAVEYARRYQEEYQAVFWVQAETRNILTNDFVQIADLLHLTGKDGRQTISLVNTVKQWLEAHTKWLMIFDNVKDVALIQEILPIQHQGHVLLLSNRSQVIRPLVQPQVLVPLTPTEWMRFLLTRAKLPNAVTLRSATWQAPAQELSEALGGLPLTLEQAGAFIKETKCSIRHYQQLYRNYPRNKRKIPEYRRGRSVIRRIEAVAITWALAFDHIIKINPELADLLYYCAFLYAEAIPIDLFNVGAPAIDSKPLQKLVNIPQQWDDAIDILQRFSLLKHQPQTEMICLPGIVQAYLKGDMRPQKRRSWIEKTIRLVNLAFPQAEEATWKSCQRYLPQALACCHFIEHENLTASEAGELLAKVGIYYFQRYQYDLASPLLEHARDTLEQYPDKEYHLLALVLSSLATIHKNQGKPEEALPLFEKTVALKKMKPGPVDPSIASTLNDMAAIHKEQGEPEKAEPLLRQALEIEDQRPEKTNPARISTLSDLAAIYQEQGQLEKAEPLLLQAMEIEEQQPEKTDAARISILIDLADLYQDQGKTGEALPLLEQALAIEEQQPERQDSKLIYILNNLADAYHQMGRDNQALHLLQKLVQIKEQQLGPEHPELAVYFLKLAECCEALGQYEEALPRLHRALDIQKQHLGNENPDLFPLFCKLTDLYRKLGRHENALSFLEQALAIKKQQLGSEHPELVEILINLAALDQYLEYYQKAAECLEQALHIREQHLGPEHLEVADRLTDLAKLYYLHQGRHEEAVPLLKRALAIRERLFGPYDIDVAPSWEELAALYRGQADLMDSRAQGIKTNYTPSN